MRRPYAIRVFLALLVLLVCGGVPGASWANNCAGGGAPRPDDSGVGGTGMRSGDDEDDSGVGGTGVAPGADDDDSGIGGTGISADTGVIGTITGFASICVGDVEIHYDAASLVQVDDQRSTAAALAVGQVVEVLAGGSGAELEARQITVRHIVAGPVTGIAADRNELEVMGQIVRLSASTRGGGDNEEALAATDLALGTVVQVSGVRQNDGSVVASRVTRSPDDVARLSGRVETLAAGRVTVAGTPVRAAGDMALATGDELRLTGGWDGTQLVIRSAERIPSLPFDGRAARVEVEGYPSLGRSGELRMGPYRFDLSPAAAEALTGLELSAPLRVEAVVRDRRAVVERVRVAPGMPPRPPGREGRAGGAIDARERGPGDHAPRDGRAEPPPRDGRDARPEGPPRDGRAGSPDRPDRPPRADRPERPPRVDRPPVPDRPDLPDRPDRPPRPGGH